MLQPSVLYSFSANDQDTEAQEIFSNLRKIGTISHSAWASVA